MGSGSSFKSDMNVSCEALGLRELDPASIVPCPGDPGEVVGS